MYIINCSSMTKETIREYAMAVISDDGSNIDRFPSALAIIRGVQMRLSHVGVSWVNVHSAATSRVDAHGVGDVVPAFALMALHVVSAAVRLPAPIEGARYSPLPSVHIPVVLIFVFLLAEDFRGTMRSVRRILYSDRGPVHLFCIPNTGLLSHCQHHSSWETG